MSVKGPKKPQLLHSQLITLGALIKCTLLRLAIVWTASPECVYLNIYKGKWAERRLLQLVLLGTLAAILL